MTNFREVLKLLLRFILQLYETGHRKRYVTEFSQHISCELFDRSVESVEQLAIYMQSVSTVH